MPENRSEPRIGTNEPIVAWWVDGIGNQRFSHGKLENISNNGLRFRSREEIPVGSRLVLRTPMGEYVGTIVRSEQDGTDWVLGIKKAPPKKPPDK